MEIDDDKRKQSNVCSFVRSMKKSRFHRSSLFSNRRRNKFSQTYRSIFSSICFCFRFYFLLVRFTRTCSILHNRIIRIVRLISDWIRIIRSIFSILHLFISTLMIFIEKLYQIFDLLTILFEPFSNRSFDKVVRAFSHGFYDYYSSNGACYTLKDRTNQIFRRVRARWKRSLSTRFIYFDANANEEVEEIFYDANDH